jgi:hypothetical protein
MGTPAVVFLIIAGLFLAGCLGYGVSLYNGLVEVGIMSIKPGKILMFCSCRDTRNYQS